MLFGATDKKELKLIKKDFLNLTILPIQEEISSMAIEMIEEYGLSYKLNFPDALIAATALFHGIRLYTLNLKDFKFIKNLNLY